MSERHRIIAAIVLAVVAAGLFATRTILGRGDVRRDTGLLSSPAMRDINDAIDTLFARYAIEKRWIKKWQVQSPGNGYLRTERRVFVPPAFISVKFTRDLNEMVSRSGARAMATERSKEQTVTVHISKDGQVIQSIAFVMKPDLAKSSP